MQDEGQDAILLQYESSVKTTWISNLISFKSLQTHIGNGWWPAQPVAIDSDPEGAVLLSTRSNLMGKHDYRA